MFSPGGELIGAPALVAGLPDGTDLEMFVRGRDTHIESLDRRSWTREPTGLGPLRSMCGDSLIRRRR
ncbi:hypothetical protein [Gordonia hongkongensis]|uniref:hypothetical protein n=1 Tax=Gordonia hongkongensis TaxID=1701090 RepID=UPI003D746566